MPTLIVYRQLDGQISLVRHVNSVHEPTQVAAELYAQFQDPETGHRAILIEDEISPQRHRVLNLDDNIAVVDKDDKRFGNGKPITEILLEPPAAAAARFVLPPPDPVDVTMELSRGITIIVPISGRWHCLATLLKFLRDCELPKCPVILSINDNSLDTEMGALLRRFLWTVSGAKYAAGTSYFQDADVRPPREDAGYRTAKIYQRAADACLTKCLLTLEDDVIPPLDAIPRLYEALVKAPADVLAAAAAVPARSNGSIMAWRFPNNEPKICEPHETVEGVSFSCSLHQARALKSLGFVPSVPEIFGAPHTDFALWLRLKRCGYRPLVIWDLKCDHLDIESGWVQGIQQDRKPDGIDDALAMVPPVFTMGMDHDQDCAATIATWRPSLRLAVVMPVYQNEDLAIRHIQLIRQASRLPDELIIVNDGSPDFADKLTPDLWWPGLRVVYAQILVDIEWNGFTGGRNLGTWLSTAEIVSFEDVGDPPFPQLYERALDLFARLPDLVQLKHKADCAPLESVMLPDFDWKPTSHLGITNGSCQVRRSALLRIGGYDEDFSGRYGHEDTLLTWQLEQIGRVHVSEQALWMNVGGGETKCFSRDATDNGQLCRERKLRQIKHNPGPILRFPWTAKVLA